MNLWLPFRRNTGDPAQPLLSDERALSTQAFQGAGYDAARRGRVFTGNMAAAGAVIPIYSNTAQVCGIWNPAGNKYNLVPLEIAVTYIDTTGAAGGYVLGLVAAAPSVVATAASISAFTDGVLGTSIFNGLVGSGPAPTCRFTPSAATVTAPVVLRHLGLNQNAFTAAGTGQMPYTSRIDFDGKLQIPPGNAIFFAGNIATLAKLAVSMTWAEELA